MLNGKVQGVHLNIEQTVTLTHPFQNNLLGAMTAVELSVLEFSSVPFDFSIKRAGRRQKFPLVRKGSRNTPEH